MDHRKDPVEPLEHEPEHKGSIWSHPYMLYVWLSMSIFGILLILGYLALQNDWLPRR